MSEVKTFKSQSFGKASTVAIFLCDSQDLNFPPQNTQLYGTVQILRITT